jgi:hypothetical protein
MEASGVKSLTRFLSMVKHIYGILNEAFPLYFSRYGIQFISLSLES